MKHIIYNNEGEILGVHHQHSAEPSTDNHNLLSIPDDDFPSDFDISSYQVRDETLIR